MRPAKPAPPPADFDALVRFKGLKALREMVSEEIERQAISEMLEEKPELMDEVNPAKKRPGRPRKALGKYQRCADIRKEDFPPCWTEVLPHLWKAFGGICNYCCLYIEEGTGDRTVDHWVARGRDWRKAYEWSNFRLACRLMNSNKGDSADVLDPFLVEDGWFALELVGFQIIPGPTASGETRNQVLQTIERLKLNRGGRISRQMERYWLDYWAKEPIPFSYLRARAPFLASEMLRQGKVRSGDA